MIEFLCSGIDPKHEEIYVNCIFPVEKIHGLLKSVPCREAEELMGALIDEITRVLDFGDTPVEGEQRIVTVLETGDSFQAVIKVMSSSILLVIKEGESTVTKLERDKISLRHPNGPRMRDESVSEDLLFEMGLSEVE